MAVEAYRPGSAFRGTPGTAQCLDRRLVGQADVLGDAEPPIRTLLLDFELTNEVDVPAAEMLAELRAEPAGVGVELMLASVHEPVRDLLARSGVPNTIGAEHLFPDVPEAVVAFAEQSPEELLVEDLTGIAARHAPEMTDEQRAALAGSATELNELGPWDPS